MLKRFFITGTDTSVGKTVVSRALLQALASSGKSVAGYKPVAKGSKETCRRDAQQRCAGIAKRLFAGVAV